MFTNFKVGQKVQSCDKDGYYIIEMCGILVEIFTDGHAIIKSFDGSFYSSIGIRKNRIAEVEAINN